MRLGRGQLTDGNALLAIMPAVKPVGWLVIPSQQCPGRRGRSQSRRSRPPVAAIGSATGGRCGIDDGYPGLAVFAVIQAGLSGAVAGAVRYRRRAIAMLAAASGAAVAGSAASHLYLHRAGQARDLGAAAG